MSSRPGPRLTATPGQTIGPFFGYALPYPADGHLVPLGHPGAVRLHGSVLDGAQRPVTDALLEIWQADAAGRPAQRSGSLARDGYTFTGWGRTPTDAAGHYSFTTVEPAAGSDGRPVFIAMTVFARGLTDRLFTRVYLPGSEDLTADPFLASVPASRRSTLMAMRDGERSLRFDVQLQGARETVFVSYTETQAARP